MAISQSVSGNPSFGVLTPLRALITNASNQIISSSTTSTQLAYLDIATGTTGTGSIVFGTSPTLVTPALGAATATSIVTSGSTNPLLRSIYTGAQSTTSGGATQNVQDDGTAIQSGNRLGSFSFLSVSDNTHTMAVGAAMRAFATQTWTATANGTQLQFLTTANGTTTQTTALTLGQDQSATFAGNVNVTNLTASQAVVTDSSKNLTSLAYASAATASALVQRDSNANGLFNNVNSGILNVTSSGGTTTLTAASPKTINITGSASQTVVLPVVTTLTNGHEFVIKSYSGTGTITVQSSGGNTIATMSNSGIEGKFVVVDTTAGTGTASWVAIYATASATASSIVTRSAGGTISSTAFSGGNFTSTSANAASSGAIRLASTDLISFRNNANSADVSIGKNTSDQWTFSGSQLVFNDFVGIGTNQRILGTQQAGTNTNSGNFTIQNPKGTGTGSVGQMRFNAGASGTGSGSTSHTAVNRLVLNGSVTTLTSGAASTLVTPTIASNSMAGGRIEYTVEASDGTDFQVTSGAVTYSITNKAGTIGGTATITSAEVSRATTGTLANTFAVTAAGLVQITPVVVGITPTTLRVTYSVQNFGQQDITLP